MCPWRARHSASTLGTVDGQAEPFGALLRGLRERAGLTREELAERAGLSPKGIAALERGDRRHPYPHTIRALAAALQLGAADRASLESSVTPRSQGPQLPAPASPLLGREADVGAAAQLLESGRTRLLTLVGPGGVGKTRLALAVAGEAAPRYRDGVALTSLAPLRDPSGVVAAVAASLGLRDSSSQPPREVLHGYLRGRNRLLVLDNFEHLLDAAVEVADLLAAAPHVNVLVTSRAPLRIGGEQVYPVEPLALPVAVQLFEERAAQVSPTAAAADAGIVAEICRRLDCLPLAIELAAARTRILGPAELCRRLDDALALLTEGARDAPERHQTLRQMIAWSYDLLRDEERAVFRLLAVFAGGWTLEAAAAVAEADETSALEAHAALLDGSLVTRDPTRPEPRFDLLQTIGALAAEHLEAAGEASRARDRHAAHYRDLVLAADRGGYCDPQPRWLDRVAQELDNVRAALQHFLHQGRVHDVTAMAYALMPYWWIRGQLREGQRWVDATLARPDLSDAADRARLHFVGGTLLYAAGAYAEAAARHRLGARLAREAGDVQALLWVLTQHAHTAAVAAPATAGALLDEAEALSRQLDEPCAALLVQMGRGLLALSTGRLVEADRHLTACEAGAVAVDAGWTLAVALDIHGMVTIGLGDLTRTERLLHRSLTIFRRLQDAWSVMYVLTSLADAAALQSDAQRAARLFGAADALGERCGATILPFLPDVHRRCRERAAAQLGADAFEALRRESWAAPLDDLVTLALRGS